MKLFRFLIRVGAVVAVLFLFLVSIHLLGEAFESMGNTYAKSLFTFRFNPFTMLFVGLLATAVVQSSSVTTSIVVGMVSGGVLSVGAAIPIVMGANIGTTVTNLLVSFGHFRSREEFRRAFSGSILHDFFNVICVVVFFPIEMIFGVFEKSAGYLAGIFYGLAGVTYHSPIKGAVKSFSKLFLKGVEDLIPLSGSAFDYLVLGLSFLMIFGCLFGLVKLLRQIMIGQVVQMMNSTLAKNGFITIGIGTLVTVLIQSSSVTTSLLVPLLGGGLLTLETAFPITLGANIGTTATALLAALAGSQAGLAIALVHLLFNFAGVLMIYPMPAIRRIPIQWARWLGDRTFEKRRMAVIYVCGVFFVLPLCVIFFTKLFH